MTHFGETLDPDNKVRVAEYNVGIAILARMGVFAHDTKTDVMNALMSVRSKEDSR